MASSKQNFLLRINALDASIKSDAVVSKSFEEVQHNNVAKMLRNGLAVVGFAALEDYIKQRCGELLEKIAHVEIPFSKLPEKLQIAVTHKAIKALSFKASVLDKNDIVPFIQEHAGKISSTSQNVYSLSNLAFGHDKSNINAQAVAEMLGCFNVDAAWNKISNVASNLGLAAMALDESFRNAAERRHKAAHVADTDTPQNDILQFVQDAIAIAIGFDFLASAAYMKIKNSNKLFLEGKSRLGVAEIKYGIVKFSEGKLKEFSSDSEKRAKRVIKKGESSDDFVIRAKNYCDEKKGFFVRFNEDNKVVDWDTFC